MLWNTCLLFKFVPSVITTTRSISASIAYKMASAAPGGGT